MEHARRGMEKATCGCGFPEVVGSLFAICVEVDTLRLICVKTMDAGMMDAADGSGQSYLLVKFPVTTSFLPFYFHLVV